MTFLFSRRCGRVAAFVLSIASVALIATGSGGLSPNASARTSSAQTATLVLPDQPGLWATPLLIAQARFFKQEGLNVKFATANGSGGVTEALIAGSGQFGIAGASGVGIAAAKGYGLVSVLSLNHDETAVLVVPKNSPIHSVKDLRGKQVGITALSDGSVPIVSAILTGVGLTPGTDVHLVVVGNGGPAVASALQSGQIAAFAGGASDMAGLVVGGHLPVRSIMPARWVGLPSDMLVVSKNTLATASGRETAIKLGRGWIEGARFGIQHPTQAVVLGCSVVPANCVPKAAGVYAAKASLTDTVLKPRPGFTTLSKVTLEMKVLGLSGKFNIPQVFSNAYVAAMNK